MGRKSNRYKIITNQLKLNAMKTVKNIKELNVSIEELYNNESQINIHLSDKPFSFTVLLKDRRGKIDCKLSSFAANLWTRTNAGISYKKYKRIQDLQAALKKEINKKIDTDGEISFSVSNEISFI